MYQITKETYGYEAPNVEPWYAYGLWNTETFTISENEFLSWLNWYFEEYGKDFFENAESTSRGFETDESIGTGNNLKTYTYIVKQI